MEVYRPHFCQNGNKVTREWQEDFVDRNGNSAVVCKVEYLDKKGKTNEAVFWVRWKDAP